MQIAVPMVETMIYRPVRFFVLTFAVTWVCWFAAPYLGDAHNGDAMFLVLMLIGLLAPFAVALYLTFAAGNEALKKTFFNKLLNIRLIRLRSLTLFMVLFPASMIASILISTTFGYSLDQFEVADEFSFTVGAVPTLLLLLLAAGFEELAVEVKHVVHHAALVSRDTGGS